MVLPAPSAQALVWGADGDIGGALVDLLLAQHWAVFAVARRADGHRAAGRAGLHPFQADVAHPDEVEAAVAAVRAAGAQPVLWVYAVGDVTSARVRETDPRAWRRVVDANLSGAFHAAHASLAMLPRDAHLVFLGARAERLRLPGLAAYAATKAGLEALATVLAREERGLRVTVVRPPAVATRLWEKLPLRMPADALGPQVVAARILAAHEAGRATLLDDLDAAEAGQG